MPNVKTSPNQSLKRYTYTFCMQVEKKPKTNKTNKPPGHATVTNQKMAGSKEGRSLFWMSISSVLASYPQQSAALQNMRHVQPVVHNKQMPFKICNREKHSVLYAVLEE